MKKEAPERLKRGQGHAGSPLENPGLKKYPILLQVLTFLPYPFGI